MCGRASQTIQIQTQVYYQDAGWSEHSWSDHGESSRCKGGRKCLETHRRCHGWGLRGEFFWIVDLVSACEECTIQSEFRGPQLASWEKHLCVLNWCILLTPSSSVEKSCFWLGCSIGAISHWKCGGLRFRWFEFLVAGIDDCCGFHGPTLFPKLVSICMP